MAHKRREKLFKENPHCYYCNVLTIFDRPTKHNKGRGWQPDNLATIEHLYSRFDPRRKIPNTNNERRHVLACYKCNHERGKAEVNALPRETQVEIGCRGRGRESWFAAWERDMNRFECF